MNCDHAFDLMTDPELDRSPALQAHLEDCRRCRQMYEILSPALGMFEHVSEHFAGGDADAATSSSVDVAQCVAVRLSECAPAARGRRRGRWIVACMAAGVIGFAAAFGLPGLLPMASPASRSLASECTWVNRPAAGDAVERSDAVVLSCVACHLSAPAE